MMSQPYIPGSQMQIADALSRLSPEETAPIPDLTVQIHEVCPQFSNEYLQTIRSETAKDPELVALKEVVYTGWSTTIKELPSVLQQIRETHSKRVRFNLDQDTEIPPI